MSIPANKFELRSCGRLYIRHSMIMVSVHLGFSRHLKRFNTNGSSPHQSLASLAEDFASMGLHGALLQARSGAVFFWMSKMRMLRKSWA